jgi:hypothetical protein
MLRARICAGGVWSTGVPTAKLNYRTEGAEDSGTAGVKNGRVRGFEVSSEKEHRSTEAGRIAALEDRYRLRLNSRNQATSSSFSIRERTGFSPLIVMYLSN